MCLWGPHVVIMTIGEMRERKRGEKMMSLMRKLGFDWVVMRTSPILCFSYYM